MKSNVYEFRVTRLPNDIKKALALLLKHTEDPASYRIDGLAFVAYLDDHGYITGAVGKAREQPRETRKMLRALDARLEKLERAG